MVSGIIAEFNIFHNGHKYLIERAREQSDTVVAVMSGSFVQRGDAAIADKWSRARAALLNGVDLVLELPTCYSLNAAQNFAAGGVNTLAALGVVDMLVFGSENGNADKLINAARMLNSESPEASDLIKTNMAQGLRYPTALENAYSGKISGGILSQPNDILAVEYIRAIMRSCCNIKPVAVKRLHSGHHDTEITDSITSASNLRGMLLQGMDVAGLIPYNLKDIGYSNPYSLARLDSALIAKLRAMTPEALRTISEVCEGLEHRVLNAARDTDNFESLAEAVKSKRYTMSKIRRILISALLDFTKDIYSPSPDYIRVLGMNKKGTDILKQAKKNCAVPIITKAADYKEKSRQFELDLRATDIAALCSGDKSERVAGKDFTHSPVVL